ncbi:[protein-PII] uridylyltransferase [Reinekea marinisedimentorum]|uniref:Bifunctional uridylyltransferase/uridylyl-removing enzyme n=1 Tax=Reinekea marinisedimentorum TaxID=230495 RepID=A0A4R3I4A0_9GAMM|nr:[protein-PII] uridylyltransferase [Reinekea marinisedimentorum]TCS40706.1 [protein-PII] uridylyltransferase [Reinekea marinisedimentorum]
MDLTRYSDQSLLDAQAITLRLQSERPIPVLKESLKHLTATLNDRYSHGASIRDLVFGRAAAMDALLQCIWRTFDWVDDDQIALIAVGGYGRGELLPCSDIDLLLLFTEEQYIDKNVDSLQSFLTLLWDIKLEVGHSVRTIEACITEAANDVTITTNLMESRALVGNASLRETLNNAVGPDKIWPSKDFYQAKIQEQEERYQKFNNTEYNLEPNVKGGPGALRDIQNIGWVAKRHFGDSSLADLVSRDFLTDAEYQDLIQGQDFLWRVRYALHMITGREEDRLLFNLQEQVAEIFGYTERGGQLAVEHLMQDYFRKVFRLNTLNTILLQHFDQTILNEFKTDQVTPINSRFQIRNDYIEVTNDNVFQRKPSSLMEIFVLCAQNESIKGIRASTMRLLFASRDLIDGAFRQDIQNISFFMELLRSPNGVFHGLMRMNRYGILGLYLPEFGRIVGQMQFDLFHVYTVDAHTLLTIRNLRSFRHANNTQRFPIATSIIHQLPKLELVYIAALYHDIGKGRNADHSQEGAKEVRRFAQRHRLSHWETELVVWLVQNHLLMSMTAQREDISDPEVINHFAQEIGDIQHLNYLYVLTVADIYATNPNLWNSWRAALIERLYKEAQRALRRGLENPVNKDELIHDTQEAAIELLEQSGMSREDVLSLWDNSQDDYFLRETPENIAWHTQSIANHGRNVPLVLIKETDQKRFAGGTQVFIYAPDRPHLFADIAATLDTLNLDIQDARIMTSSTSDFSLDTFIVLERDGQSIGNNEQRLFEIQHKLLLEIQNPHDSPLPNRRITRQLKHFKVPAEVTVSNDMVNNRTIVEVMAADRPGLLADIGRCFRRLNLTLLSARISTLGEHVEDVFFILDKDGNQLSDLKDVQTLQSELLETISEAMER